MSELSFADWERCLLRMAVKVVQLIKTPGLPGPTKLLQIETCLDVWPMPLHVESLSRVPPCGYSREKEGKGKCERARVADLGLLEFAS